MNKRVISLLAATTMLAVSLSACSEESVTLTFGTGGTSGTYYAVGGVMATVLNQSLEESQLNVVSTGASKANIQMIEAGEADLAIVQNDVMSYAARGTDLFEEDGVYDSFSTVMTMYPETCQIIAVPGIESVADLAGKTVSVGDAGSGVEFNANQILEAYGLSFDDITVVNASFADSAASLKDGKIDAAFVTAGAPTTAVVELTTTTDITIVPISSADADDLIAMYPYYTKLTIPGGTYSGIDEDVETVAVMATLIASNDLSEDVVYELISSIFSEMGDLTTGHDKFNEFDLATCADGVDVAFHPGAQKYLEEQGVL